MHLLSFQEEADTKRILLAHEILNKSSSKVSKVAIHSPSHDTHILLPILVHLYKCKERIYIIDNHGQYKKNIRLSSIIFEDEIINSLLDFMHLLGTIISVHFIEKERQHALKYSRAVPNFEVRLQHLELN